jgi:hypothetical protein
MTKHIATHHVPHARRYAGGMTLQVVYGYKADSNDDRFLKLAEDVLKILANEVAASGKVWIVDVFPFRKHLCDAKNHVLM